MAHMIKSDPGFLFKEGFFGSLVDVEGRAQSHLTKAFASDDTVVRMDQQEGCPNRSLQSTIDGPLSSVRAMFAPPMRDTEITVGTALKKVFSYFKK